MTEEIIGNLICNTLQDRGADAVEDALEGPQIMIVYDVGSTKEGFLFRIDSPLKRKSFRVLISEVPYAN